ncbi:unnamed protein product [Aspergillus oryzae RIB40]|uniref:DNA, SC011 n=1 Tax=Aspergillus oryzae (strain ATCC 42149 / RIB 40) TaxID=510516 RepID=Q2TZM0_ASPOR|nr:unnamed protein product [Aspergillus oryzae RIB40]BAE65245.1 unnamed protein product [Aspergillus oryzae RIB40]
MVTESLFLVYSHKIQQRNQIKFLKEDLNLRKNLQSPLRLLLHLLNQPTNSPKPTMTCVPQNLKQNTLTTRHYRPSISQPRQSNPPLLTINTAHPIHNNINPMAPLQHIQRRLRNTDMRLNSHDNSIEGRFPGSCLG